MITSMNAFDLVLCLSLMGLAAAAIFSRTLFRSVILFMVFGLLMALGWARLQAPDIALTEAALGAGLTGALLLHALRIFKTGTPSPGNHEPETSPVEKTNPEGKT